MLLVIAAWATVLIVAFRPPKSALENFLVVQEDAKDVSVTPHVGIFGVVGSLEGRKPPSAKVGAVWWLLWGAAAVAPAVVVAAVGGDYSVFDATCLGAVALQAVISNVRSPMTTAEASVGSLLQTCSSLSSRLDAVSAELKNFLLRSNRDTASDDEQRGEGNDTASTAVVAELLSRRLADPASFADFKATMYSRPTSCIAAISAQLAGPQSLLAVVRSVLGEPSVASLSSVTPPHVLGCVGDVVFVGCLSSDDTIHAASLTIRNCVTAVARILQRAAEEPPPMSRLPVTPETGESNSNRAVRRNLMSDRGGMWCSCGVAIGPVVFGIAHASFAPFLQYYGPSVGEAERLRAKHREGQRMGFSYLCSAQWVQTTARVVESCSSLHQQPVRNSGDGSDDVYLSLRDLTRGCQGHDHDAASVSCHSLASADDMSCSSSDDGSSHQHPESNDVSSFVEHASAEGWADDLICGPISEFADSAGCTESSGSGVGGGTEQRAAFVASILLQTLLAALVALVITGSRTVYYAAGAHSVLVLGLHAADYTRHWGNRISLLRSRVVFATSILQCMIAVSIVFFTLSMASAGSVDETLAGAQGPVSGAAPSLVGSIDLVSYFWSHSSERMHHLWNAHRLVASYGLAHSALSLCILVSGADHQPPLCHSASPEMGLTVVYVLLAVTPCITACVARVIHVLRFVVWSAQSASGEGLGSFNLVDGSNGGPVMIVVGFVVLIGIGASTTRALARRHRTVNSCHNALGAEEQCRVICRASHRCKEASRVLSFLRVGFTRPRLLLRGGPDITSSCGLVVAIHFEHPEISNNNNNNVARSAASNLAMDVAALHATLETFLSSLCFCRGSSMDACGSHASSSSDTRISCASSSGSDETETQSGEASSVMSFDETSQRGVPVCCRCADCVYVQIFGVIVVLHIACDPSDGLPRQGSKTQWVYGATSPTGTRTAGGTPGGSMYTPPAADSTYPPGTVDLPLGSDTTTSSNFNRNSVNSSQPLDCSWASSTPWFSSSSCFLPPDSPTCTTVLPLGESMDRSFGPTALPSAPERHLVDDSCLRGTATRRSFRANVTPHDRIASMVVAQLRDTVIDAFETPANQNPAGSVRQCHLGVTYGTVEIGSVFCGSTVSISGEPVTVALDHVLRGAPRHAALRSDTQQISDVFG